jgi:hypothetical protein
VGAGIKLILYGLLLEQALMRIGNNSRPSSPVRAGKYRLVTFRTFVFIMVASIDVINKLN